MIAVQDLFEQENTMESLSNMGNPLVVLKDIIDFEQFRSMLESLFANDHKKSSRNKARKRCRIEHVFGFM